MRSKYKFWPEEYVIAVTKGTKTKFFYGQKLKDAMAAAGKAIAGGAVFSYTKFTRGKVSVAELRGRTLVTHA